MAVIWSRVREEHEGQLIAVMKVKMKHMLNPEEENWFEHKKNNPEQRFVKG